MEWEKIFENHTPNKGSVSRTWKGLLQVSKKTITQFLNGQSGLQEVVVVLRNESGPEKGGSLECSRQRE